MKWLLAILCMSCPWAAHALADIEGKIEIIGGNFIAPGTVARAILTIKNNGPDIEKNVVMGAFFFGTVGFRTVSVVRVSETAPCLLQFDVFVPPPVPPLQPSTVVATIQTLQDLRAGESTSCVVGLVTFPESPPVVRQRFSFGFLENDPNPLNNEVFLVIRTKADVLPIPTTSTFGNIGLALGIFLLVLPLLHKRDVSFS